MGRLQRNGGELMKLTMLGTGNALVTECYNTCFVVQNGKKHLLVDGGGGNTLLAQMCIRDRQTIMKIICERNSKDMEKTSDV